MKSAIYARVAIDQPIESQLCDLRQISAERGFESVTVYSDRRSGTKARRPGLDALLRDARNRRFDVVLVASIDRVARSIKHFVQVMNELDGLGIRFLSLAENIDTAGTTGRLFLDALDKVAALERSLGCERIKVGMRRAKFEGQRLGRQPLDVDRNAIVRDRLAGMSLTNVAKKYGISRASVVRFVREAGGREAAKVGFSADLQLPPAECVA